MNLPLRHSRVGGSPVEFAIFDCMPLDSRLRGNDEKYEGMEFNDLNCYRLIDVAMNVRRCSWRGEDVENFVHFFVYGASSRLKSRYHLKHL